MNTMTDGYNAWLDVNLNQEDFNEEQIQSSQYARRNANNSRFFDIDDIPSRNPIVSRETNREEIIERAHALTNNDNIDICRHTGMQITMGNGRRGNNAQYLAPPDRDSNIISGAARHSGENKCGKQASERNT